MKKDENFNKLCRLFAAAIINSDFSKEDIRSIHKKISEEDLLLLKKVLSDIDDFFSSLEENEVIESANKTFAKKEKNDSLKEIIRKNIAFKRMSKVRVVDKMKKINSNFILPDLKNISSEEIINIFIESSTFEQVESLVQEISPFGFDPYSLGISAR